MNDSSTRHFQQQVVVVTGASAGVHEGSRVHVTSLELPALNTSRRRQHQGANR